MGEIAEMMIEGTLCCECGVALECEAIGIPIYCHDCHRQYKKKCSQPHQGSICERFYGKATNKVKKGRSDIKR